MPKRQVILMKSVDPADDDDGGLPALGSTKDVLAALARFNTAPDGRERGGGGGGGGSGDIGVLTLYGPGMVVEMPTMNSEPRQLMVTMTDDDFAFPVLRALCRDQRWTMLDPESGRRLSFGS